MIDDWVMCECAEELAAHHWSKHTFEALQCGCSTPREISRGMIDLCRQAAAFPMHD